MGTPVSARGRTSHRGWIRVASALALLTAAIGALHTPMARPLLMRLGGCPMAGAQMTPEQMDRARHIAVSGQLGTLSAPARPALGFTLDRTTAAEVHAWAEREHVDCEDVRAGLIRCVHVAPKAIDHGAAPGAVDELAFGFNARGELVNVTTFRAHLRAETAAREAETIASGLSEQLGAAKTDGAFEPTRLGISGAQSLASASYRYTDYFADVTAMNLPHSGPSIREHYLSAHD